MEKSNNQDESTDIISEKEAKPELEFDRLTSTNKELANFAKEADRKYQQLQGRYKEMKGKLTLKLTDTMKSVKTLMANVNDASAMKEVMGLLKGELDNSINEYTERLALLKKH